MTATFRARCFGLAWRADLPIDGFDSAAELSGPVDVNIRRVAALTPRAMVTVGRNADFCDDGFRFRWHDQATFDVSDGTQIDYCPGPSWPGNLPHSFYGTVAALTCAWRGLLALHSSSVILHDRAWLIGGAAGAGKSTLTAELLRAGGLLLADDLTIIDPGAGPNSAQAVRGRPAIRLHPLTAAAVAGSAPQATALDPRGKLMAIPESRAEDRRWPIGGILMLGGSERRALTGPEVAATLGMMVFRPRLIRHVPRLTDRRLALLQLAQGLPGWAMPAIRQFGDAATNERVAATLEVIAQMAASSMPLPLRP